MAMQRNYFEDVFEVVKLIPTGRVTSYGAIAHYLGLKSGARMVGWALSHCITHEEGIPAHRVVNSKGLLSGRHHFGTPTRMQELLEEEGVSITDDSVDNFKDVFWNPALELM